MKILMLTPYLPYPLLSGGQTRSYNLIKNLSDKHEITLFSLIKEEKEKEYIKELDKFCKKVVVFRRSAKPWTLKNIVKTGFSLYPFLVIRNLSQEEKKAVSDELDKEHYDLIHSETFYAMPHLPHTDLPILLVDQTIEYLVYKHYVEKQSPIWARFLLKIDVAKIRYWETYFWKRASRVVAMSEADREAMKKLAPGLNVDVVPNGIDTHFFKVNKKKEEKEKKILYVGNFKWMQNIEAVEILYKKIWPIIKREIPDSKLWIVGMAMTKEIKNIAGNDVEVTEGIVDIREAYKNSDVLVAPIKGPGGTRLKILEAMASGVPVVTTTTGIEGLDVEDKKHVLIADSEGEIASDAIKVLKDKKLAQKLCWEARKLTEEKYSWLVSAESLNKIYHELIQVKK